jgi:hypothetical protein
VIWPICRKTYVRIIFLALTAHTMSAHGTSGATVQFGASHCHCVVTRSKRDRVTPRRRRDGRLCLVRLRANGRAPTKRWAASWCFFPRSERLPGVLGRQPISLFACASVSSSVSSSVRQAEVMRHTLELSLSENCRPPDLQLDLRRSHDSCCSKHLILSGS